MGVICDLREVIDQSRLTHFRFSSGYLVTQLVADNPGVWPFHCHIVSLSLPLSLSMYHESRKLTFPPSRHGMLAKDSTSTSSRNPILSLKGRRFPSLWNKLADVSNPIDDDDTVGCFGRFWFADFEREMSSLERLYG